MFYAFPTVVRKIIPGFPWLVQIYACCLRRIMKNILFPLKAVPIWMVNDMSIRFLGNPEKYPMEKP